jgi:hypothetical protein
MAEQRRTAAVFYNLHRHVLQILFRARSSISYGLPFEDRRCGKPFLIHLARIVLDHRARLPGDRRHFGIRVCFVVE